MRSRLPAPVPRARALSGLAALVLGSGLVALAPAGSAEQPAVEARPVAPTVLATPSPELPGLPATSLDLAAVPVDSSAFRRATDEYLATDAAHTSAREERLGLDRSATSLRARVRTLQNTQVAATARIRGLRARVADLEAAIQQLAVRAFMAGDTDERLNTALTSDSPSISEVERRDVLGGASMDVLLNERAAYLDRIDEATERATAADEELEAAEATMAALAEDRPAALDAEATAGAEVATSRVDYEEARVLATVDGVEFPLVALDAYYRAATQVSDERPGCQVQWWGLAGISRVEGHHGTYGGATLRADGSASRRIIGISLDGTNNTAVVADTDGGALDGDPAQDRAVGPMQFIPQTWNRFKGDGDGDGTMTPFNLYDATLAAATYLCTVSGDLDSDAGLRRAYFAYNHSEAYVDAVLGYARLYERAVPLATPGA